jgi:hypothetical protein
MARGKTPSLIGSSLGRPTKQTCGRNTPCSRCGEGIPKGKDCYDVPQPAKPHSSTRRFCTGCFNTVLEQTSRDLDELRALCADAVFDARLKTAKDGS